MDDRETEMMGLVMAALDRLEPGELPRALDYINRRMGERVRGRGLQRAMPFVPPLAWWTLAGDIGTASEDEGDVLDGVDTFEIAELVRVAPVEQKFAVRVLTSDREDGEATGDEILWFGTREEAQRYFGTARDDG